MHLSSRSLRGNTCALEPFAGKTSTNEKKKKKKKLEVALASSSCYGPCRV